MSLRTQIIASLSSGPKEPKRIAIELGVGKKEINSILYHDEGATFHQINKVPPKWMLKPVNIPEARSNDITVKKTFILSMLGESIPNNDAHSLFFQPDDMIGIIWEASKIANSIDPSERQGIKILILSHNSYLDGLATMISSMGYISQRISFL
jgi:hypothetical protein